MCIFLDGLSCSGWFLISFSLSSAANSLLPNLIRNFRRRGNLTSFLFSLARSAARSRASCRGLVPRIFLSATERTSDRPSDPTNQFMSLPRRSVWLVVTNEIHSLFFLSRSISRERKRERESASESASDWSDRTTDRLCRLSAASVVNVTGS